MNTRGADTSANPMIVAITQIRSPREIIAAIRRDRQPTARSTPISRVR